MSVQTICSQPNDLTVSAVQLGIHPNGTLSMKIAASLIKGSCCLSVGQLSSESAYTMMQQRCLQSNALTLRWSRDLSDFAKMWPRSCNVGDARCHVFQCADFLEVWCDTIGAARGTETCFIAVLDDRERPLMLFPLGVEKRQGVRVLTFLDGGVSDYNAPVLFPESGRLTAAIVSEIWPQLLRVTPKFDIATLEKIPRQVQDLDNPLNSLATSQFPVSGHAVTLTERWDEYAAKRMPRKQDTRRKQRRLSEIGKLEFTVATTPEERGALIETMIRQKSRRYLETRGTDSFNRPGYRSFYREATSRLGSHGGCVQMSALALDGRILAAHWGCVVAKRFYYLMPSYEGGEWQRFSPGRLLLNNLIEWSIKNGIATFDQGIGEEGYKDEYCDVTLPLYQIEHPKTLLGQMLLLQRRTKEGLRHVGVLELMKSLVRTARRWTSAVHGVER